MDFWGDYPMNIQRSNRVLFHRPDSQGLRAAIQVVRSGGRVNRGAGNRLKRWNLLMGNDLHM
jgi:hypothetical protein